MISWDEEKNKLLKLKRNISFEEIADIIIEERHLDILKHPTRENQKIFIVELKQYIHAVPFVVDDNDNIFLKTAFPSRKLHKQYRG